MGSYSHTNPANRMKARALLRKLLPEASRRADEMPSTGGMAESSAIFDRMAEHISEDGIAGVHVYPAPKGGWHADVAFDGLPEGIPPVAGTPKSMPCASRDEALEAALGILSLMLSVIRTRKAAPGKAEDAAFIFEETVLRVPTAMLDSISKMAGKPEEGFAARRLSEIAAELGLESPVTPEKLSRIGHDAVVRLHAVAAMGLLSGIYRWPENEDAPPLAHRH